jgi:predicted GNAT family acetyltransferase
MLCAAHRYAVSAILQSRFNTHIFAQRESPAIFPPFRTPPMTGFAALDNPIWHALSTRHASLAHARGRAARYPVDVAPFAALREPTPEAFAELGTLLAPGEAAALFTAEEPEVPDTWESLRGLWIEQMVCSSLGEAPRIAATELDTADVPDMLALTAATAPGPFSAGTIRMGRYIGVRDGDGRLMAMAGQRLSLEKLVEISAVCCAPEFRGRGLARALAVALAADALAEGRVPFLHVKTDNGAKYLYEKIGFVMRRAIRLTIAAPRS